MNRVSFRGVKPAGFHPGLIRPHYIPVIRIADINTFGRFNIQSFRAIPEYFRFGFPAAVLLGDNQAIEHLQRSVEDPTPEVAGWFNRVEAVAHQLMRDVKVPEDVHPEVAALSAIYEASYSIDGHRLVNITFGDTAEVCGYSGSLVSKTLIRLFHEED